MRGRAEAARRAHNPEVIGSNPIPATFYLSFRVKDHHILKNENSEMIKIKSRDLRVSRNEEVLIESAYELLLTSRKSRCSQATTNINLGYDFVTDMLVLEFFLDSKRLNISQNENPWLSRAANSLAEALHLSASQVLDIEFIELITSYRVRQIIMCIDLIFFYAYKIAFFYIKSIFIPLSRHHFSQALFSSAILFLIESP